MKILTYHPVSGHVFERGYSMYAVANAILEDATVYLEGRDFQREIISANEIQGGMFLFLTGVGPVKVSEVTHCDYSWVSNGTVGFRTADGQHIRVGRNAPIIAATLS